MKKIAFFFILLTAAVFVSGCTPNTVAGQDIALDTIRAHYVHDGSWSHGPGWYEKVSEYAYNAGNTGVDREC